MKQLNSYVNFTIGLYIVPTIKVIDKFWRKYFYKMKNIKPYYSDYTNYKKELKKDLQNNEMYIYGPSSLWFKKYMKFYPDKMNWCIFSKSEDNVAMRVIKNNLDKVDWMYISENPNPKIENILRKNIDKISLGDLICNKGKWVENFVDEMKFPIKNYSFSLSYSKNEWVWKNYEITFYNGLTSNTSKWAGEFIDKNFDELVEDGYLQAITYYNNGDFMYDLVMKHPELIDYKDISRNGSKWALKFLKNNIDKVDWQVFDNNNIYVNDRKSSNICCKLFDKLIYENKL